MEFKIRKPKESEFKRIARVVNSEFQQYSKVLSKDELVGIGIGHFGVNDLISGKKERNYLVATIDNKIIGFISWYVKPNKIAWVSMLEVLPEYQGQGAASALFEILEKQTKRKNAKAIALEVQSKASWAVRFYKKKGYKKLSQILLSRLPYKGTLLKPPVKNTYIFGKLLK